jgi:hypothetical protein
MGDWEYWCPRSVMRAREEEREEERFFTQKDKKK